MSSESASMSSKAIELPNLDRFLRINSPTSLRDMNNKLYQQVALIRIILYLCNQTCERSAPFQSASALVSQVAPNTL